VAEHCNLYQRAIYYDIIFNRDVRREADFLLAAYKHFAGTTPKSVIDMACGPGYHGLEMAKRGLKTHGLDLRLEMCQLGQEHAKAAGVSIDWIEADMRTFKMAEPVDLAFCMFDGVDCLLENSDFVKHFQAMASNLTAKGLYIIDLSPINECSFDHYKKFHYSGKRNQTQVDIYWATNNPHYDLVTQTAHVELEMHINENGKKTVIKDSADERLLFPQEINFMAEVSGAMRVVGWFGDFNLQSPLKHSPETKRMLAVLQKVG
jgi:SAM-dependent methyltransferase